MVSPALNISEEARDAAVNEYQGEEQQLGYYCQLAINNAIDDLKEQVEAAFREGWKLNNISPCLTTCNDAWLTSNARKQIVKEGE